MLFDRAFAEICYHLGGEITSQENHLEKIREKNKQCQLSTGLQEKCDRHKLYHARVDLAHLYGRYGRSTI
ncbi:MULTISPECIES: hypothetical protein [unclassified Microcoleus]|uniref:hypothetical protein n=1 Tax=unclassified Microcoleus TaxID=2642155 RepID=UPI002FD340F6